MTREQKLEAALKTILSMDVKGHQLQDRLQFSTAGREILEQCNKALSVDISSFDQLVLDGKGRN